MHQLLKQDVAPQAGQSGLLAPDTTGMNFYRADPALTDLLRIHLPDALCESRPDAVVSAALRLVHDSATRPIRVAELAAASGLSRSAYVRRFRTATGQTPRQYLTQWRLSEGARKLRTSGSTVAAAAEAAGYESEAAFSRAFKRQFELSPAAYGRGAAETVGVDQRADQSSEGDLRQPLHLVQIR